jgi:hypothetical protein
MKTASIVCLFSCCAALLAGRPLTDVSLPGRSVGAAEANELIGGQCAKLNNISCGPRVGCDGALSGFFPAGDGVGGKPSGDGCTTSCRIYRFRDECTAL